MAAAPKVLMPSGRIAPYPILARELVRQTIGRQPFKHAIQRHAIDIVTALEPPLNLVMRQGFAGAEQRIQHFASGARLPRAGRRE